MASKRALRRRACGTKQRFGTYHAAYRAVHALQRKEPQRSAGMQPYPCPFCRTYHYGHAPRRDAS